MAPVNTQQSERFRCCTMLRGESEHFLPFSEQIFPKLVKNHARPPLPQCRPTALVIRRDLMFLASAAHCLNFTWWTSRCVAWAVKNWCERRLLQFAPARKCERWLQGNSHQNRVQNVICIKTFLSWCSTRPCKSKVLWASKRHWRVPFVQRIWVMHGPLFKERQAKKTHLHWKGWHA